MEGKPFFKTSKRVDESWKDQVLKEKGEVSAATEKGEEPTQPSFSTFITSLGVQALIEMGAMKSPSPEQVTVNLDTARESIDLLLMLKDKTRGNLSQEENRLLNSLIADLQLKFVEQKMSQ